MPDPALCPGHASPRAFPPIGRLPSTTSAAADQTALFGASQVLCKPSDSSPLPRQLCLLGFLPWPGTALAIAGETRSPRFRRDPFARDVFSDPGRANDASHNGIAHVAFDPFHGLRPCGKPISWLNSTPHAIAVYASQASSPALMQHSLPGGLLRPYPNRSSTGWITPASPGARKAGLGYFAHDAYQKMAIIAVKPVSWLLCHWRDCGIERHPTDQPPHG